ncbi:MAG: hypothetical protein JSR41_05110 [Proteobacteria bacterium]|nr:hypothetical protein [Pseudomonadota bacterium]
MKLPSNHVAPSRKIIRKSCLFDLSALRGETPEFAFVLASAIEQLSELPDFSEANTVSVMSDFGGEHPAARFRTYSFLFFTANRSGPFVQQVSDLRSKHGILKPYSEFRYKRLASGNRSRALPEFLSLVDSLIHGAVITVAVEKKIDSLFGGAAHIEKTLAELGFGRWKKGAGEKVLRVAHTFAIFASLLVRPDQPIIWYCDNDAINDNGQERKFEDTQRLFARALQMYSAERSAELRCGKSLAEKSFLDDFLSIPDLAAGVIQDLLAGHLTGEDLAGGDEKVHVIKWLAAESSFLSKITIQILRRGDEILTGKVAFTPALQ